MKITSFASVLALLPVQAAWCQSTSAPEPPPAFGLPQMLAMLAGVLLIMALAVVVAAPHDKYPRP